MRDMYQGLLERAARAARRGDPMAVSRIAELEQELAVPPFPEAVRYLWDIFWRLRARVSGGGFGAPRISWPDILAYLTLFRVRLAPWEIEIIEALDNALIRSSQEKKDSDAD